VTARADLTSWIQSLKGEVERASDSRIFELLENPALAPAQTRGVAPVVPPPLPETPAAIRAAIADTFTFADIAGLDSETNERAILANADTVMIAGRRRLRLMAGARARLLNAVSGSPVFKEILRAECERDVSQFEAISDDEIRRNSAWLRCFLSGQIARLDRPPVSELRSALCARERLAGVNLPARAPSIAEVRRMLGLGELLEPLRILIGSGGGWDGVTPLKDRFVGRETQLSELRAFVDELASKGALETVVRSSSRFGEKVSRMATGRVVGIKLIATRGGLGKSSLVAKFMLDHAIGATNRFPFAYLDFDRAALQPREPRQLLLEVMRQVALQFPDMSETTERLSQMLRAELQDQSVPMEQQTRTASTDDAYGIFRSALQLRVTHGSHAFLLVLDTMEVVQSDPRALDGVLTFVKRLCNADFPEARIVVTGRADVPELRLASATRAEGKLISLSALSVTEARKMAAALGHSLLGTSWQSKWSNRIAGDSHQPDERREPLTVRVAVDLVRSAEPNQRDDLTLQIEEMGENASGNFVGALYQRRVLDHVRDKEVKKLAWPGLVLRRVTLDIVQEVLAEPCNLNRELIPETFQSLARETWIVDRDGDALRHQPDLRARTLPLMRRYDPAKFDEVNKRAVGYFGERQADDLRSRAEWIYHRLMDGESRTSIEDLWTADLAPFLVGADADFKPGSDAANFLFAHTARRLEQGAKTANLDVNLTLEHIANTAPYLANFDDDKINTTICELPLERASPHQRSDAAALALVVLGAKTGRWEMTPSDMNEARRDPLWSAPAEFATSFVAARAHSHEDMGVEYQILVPVRDRGNSPALVQELAFQCMGRRHPFLDTEEEIRSALVSGQWRVGRKDLSTLRTAMLFGPRIAQLAAESWMQIQRQSDRLIRKPGFSAAELRAFAGVGRLKETIAEHDKGLFDSIFGRSSPRKLVVSDSKIVDAATSTLMSCALSERSADSGVTRALQKFAAARDEDWLIPMAYAAYRATSGKIPATCMELASSYDTNARGLLGRLGNNPRPEPLPTDILQLLSLADSAGDLAGMAALFADEYAGAENARDLNRLLRLHHRWRARIEDFLRDPPK
jgi:hypothetical protein